MCKPEKGTMVWNMVVIMCLQYFRILCNTSGRGQYFRNWPRPPYLTWSVLQKSLIAFAKSSILEIYLTGSPKFPSDWEIHFMNIKTKTMYIKLKRRTY